MISRFGTSYCTSTSDRARWQHLWPAVYIASPAFDIRPAGLLCGWPQWPRTCYTIKHLLFI